MFSQFLHNTVRICCFLIHFVNSHNDWHFCCFRMVNCFNCLRHNTVISCYNENCYIGNFRTAGTHSCERSVSRSIKESNLFAVFFNLISSDMLSDSACFSRSYFRVADGVKQCCFTMVNVSHDCYNRWTFHQLGIFIFSEVYFKIGCINQYLFFYFNTVFTCNQLNRIFIKFLVNGCHNTKHK